MLTQLEVFRSGDEGYHTYRIPALITTSKGTLFAFCEGRKNSRSDTGNIDLLLKRSFDNGKTWTKSQVIADHREDTIGNPCPVIDRDTGTIWLLLTGNPGFMGKRVIVHSYGWGTRTVWLTKSTDDGTTWAPLVEITKIAKEPHWTWYATGPGGGVQLSSGRLLVPCDHHEGLGSMVPYSHVLYSDDHGKTWQRGGTVGRDTHECQAVELEDGSVLLNMRSYHGEHRRAIARSRDGGLTWSKVKLCEALIEPVCQGSFVRFMKASESSKNRVLFSNPAATERIKMTVRVSYDEGETWAVSKLLHGGPSAYSSLAILPDKTIGCLYERGDKSPYEKITLARFNIEWLTDGADRLS